MLPRCRACRYVDDDDDGGGGGGDDDDGSATAVEVIARCACHDADNLSLLIAANQ